MGVVDGVLFFLLAHFYLLPVVARRIEHSELGQYLLLKDSTDIYDPLSFERKNALEYKSMKVKGF